MNAVVDRDRSKSEGYEHGDKWGWNPTEEELDLIRHEQDSLHRLHPQGVFEAQLANETLKHIRPNGFDKVYVSNYNRALETGYYALEGYEDQNVYLESRIVERDWGDYGRMSRGDANTTFPLVAKHKKDAPYFTRLPGGQSLSDLEISARSMSASLHRQHDDYGVENVMLISHGEFMKVMVKVLTANGFPDISFNNCDIVQIQSDPLEIDSKRLRIIPAGLNPDPEMLWQSIDFHKRKFKASDLLDQLN